MIEIDGELARTFTLRDKVGVITGAGSGLGQEAARVFAQAGARLVLADIDEAGMAATAELAAGNGARAHCRRVDVAARDEVEALADWAVGECGKVDIWVNGAGVSYLHSLLETDPVRAEKVVAVNMMGPYWGCMAAGRVMCGQGGGAIVNISSGGGSKPLPGIGLYGMTKAAVNSLTWTSAAELGRYGASTRSPRGGSRRR